MAMRTKPTDRQVKRLARIVAYLGKDRVKEYFYKQFPYGNFDNPTKNQCQKLITGLGHLLPTKPITGVVGRDVAPSQRWRFL